MIPKTNNKGSKMRTTYKLNPRNNRYGIFLDSMYCKRNRNDNKINIGDTELREGEKKILAGIKRYRIKEYSAISLSLKSAFEIK